MVGANRNWTRHRWVSEHVVVDLEHLSLGGCQNPSQFPGFGDIRMNLALPL